MEPATTQAAPARVSVGETVAFDTRVTPNGVENLAGAAFSVRYDPSALEVASIVHIDSTLEFAFPTLLDNQEGNAGFAAITFTPLAGDQEPFDFATVTFRAKSSPGGGVYQVVFEFDPRGDKTAVTDSEGRQLLDVTQDYTGAWIEIVP